MTTSPFVVLHGNSKLDLEATAEGFALHRESGPLRVQWRDVRSMTRPDMMSVKFEFLQHPLVQFAFQSVADRNRFMSLAKVGIPGASDKSSVSAPADPRPQPAVRPADIGSYVVAGIVLQVVGGLVAGIALGNWTSTEMFTGETTVRGGAVAALCLGVLAASAGAFCLLVAVIAKGVQVGMSSVSPRSTS